MAIASSPGSGPALLRSPQNLVAIMATSRFKINLRKAGSWFWGSQMRGSDYLIIEKAMAAKEASGIPGRLLKLKRPVTWFSEGSRAKE